MRPSRLTILAELGQSRTLPAGPEQHQWLRGAPPTDYRDILLLGLGPEPRLLAASLPPVGVCWLECPQLEAQMPPAWAAAIPPGWTRLTLAELTTERLARSQALVYAPGQRLFPSFWGPLLARARLAILGSPAAVHQEEVWLPARERGLLIPELTRALQGHGLTVRHLPAPQAPAMVPALLAHGAPRLYLSVNFAGLDPVGELFELLTAAGSSVAVWCVDNPFHLLSGLGSAYWQRLRLFVTDASFVEPLRRHGAAFVEHLPLATDPEIFHPRAPAVADVAARLGFVGRSAFPGKQDFFAGLHLPQDAWEEAQGMLATGSRPDFFWWSERLGVERCWPGKEVRRAGLGAEESGRLWRGRCLRAATLAGLPLTVFGDAAWREHVPELADLRPEVDYYGPLAGIYASCQAVLNCTSPLLPAGLTQRHFDVWAAGGLLLSDATPGLEIFPQELVREIRFGRAGDIPGLFERFARDPDLRREVCAAWRALILTRHSYAARTARLLELSR